MKTNLEYLDHKDLQEYVSSLEDYVDKLVNVGWSINNLPDPSDGLHLMEKDYLLKVCLEAYDEYQWWLEEE